MPRNYWMLVDSLDNFRVTREQGFTVQGVKKRQRKKVQRMEPGDRLLYYLEDARCFAAMATVTSTFFEDHTPFWKSRKISDDYPYRVHIEPNAVLEEEEFLDARELGPGLEYIRKWPPEWWPLAFIGHLHLISKRDFSLIEEEMNKVIARRAGAAS